MMDRPVYIFIVPFFPSENCHGGSYIYDQVQAIQASGLYDVYVFEGTSSIQKDGDYEFEGITVHKFKEYQLPGAIWDGVFDGFNVKSFEKCIKRSGIDVTRIKVAHAHTLRPGIYALHIKHIAPKAVTILQHHGYDVLGLTDGRFARFNWHKKHAISYGLKICNEIDLHIGVSKATLESLNAIKNIRIKDSYVLYNGIDKTKFFPIQREENKIFTIGCVANFWKIKDHITLIKAVEILTKEYKINVNAWLIGRGATLDYCKEYVSTNNLSEHIEFLEPLPHNEMRRFYQSLDLFVLPSYWDTLGCVYLEAYACGVPFMTAEGTGIAELIPEEEKSKWIAPKSDAKTLAHMIKYYIDERPKQTLTQGIDITTLIEGLLNKIGSLNSCNN